MNASSPGSARLEPISGCSCTTPHPMYNRPGVGDGDAFVLCASPGLECGEMHPVSQAAYVAPGAPEYYAEMWECGDECECRQPQISRCVPFPGDVKRGSAVQDGDHALSLEWSGTLHSDPDAEEAASQAAELREAAERYGIVLDPVTLTGYSPRPAEEVKR